MEEVIVGVVGVLQFEVLEYRLKNEYNVDIHMERLPYEHIRWIEMRIWTQTLNLTPTQAIQDLKGNRLLIFANSGALTGRWSTMKG